MEKKVHEHSTSIGALREGLGSEKKARQGTDKAVTELKTELSADLEVMSQQLLTVQAKLEQGATEQARLEKLMADMAINLAEVRVAEAGHESVVGRGGGRATALGGQPGLLQHTLQFTIAHD